MSIMAQRKVVKELLPREGEEFTCWNNCPTDIQTWLEEYSAKVCMPELDLMMDVIRLAIFDLFPAKLTKTSSARQADAKEWFQATGVDYLYDFESCCGFLFMNPDSVRKALRVNK